MCIKAYPASDFTEVMGTAPFGTTTRTASPQPLNRAETERAALPFTCVVPSTRIGGAAPAVATYIVSDSDPDEELCVALTAIEARPKVLDTPPLVRVPPSFTS